MILPARTMSPATRSGSATISASACSTTRTGCAWWSSASFRDPIAVERQHHQILIDRAIRQHQRAWLPTIAHEPSALVHADRDAIVGGDREVDLAQIRQGAAI